jgi:hypothetical protein
MGFGNTPVGLNLFPPFMRDYLFLKKFLTNIKLKGINKSIDP